MKKFEIMTIAKSSQGEKSAKDLSKKVQEEIKALKGKIVETNFWGKRKFAYELEHETEGYYDVLIFELDSAKIDKLKSKLNLTEGLVRYLITAVS
jgi:small subunit ribosomal protein S6